MRCRRTTIRTLVAGLALAVTSLATLGCRYVEVDGIGTRTMDEADPPQHDLSSFGGCSKDTLNRWKASGELRNNTDTAASYEVVVAFYDGDVRLDERSEWVRDLKAGETASLDGSWWIDEPDRVTSCEVLLINRFG